MAESVKSEVPSDAVQGPQGLSNRNRQIMNCLGLGAGYVVVSAVMIHSNKWMMRDDHFPYSSVLCMMHMLVSTVMSVVGCKLFPSWFTALRTLKVDGVLLLKFLPIGVAFAGSLCFSNEAYIYLNVAFIQMLKESNIAIIFGGSVLLGLQQFSKTAVLLLFVVVGGATLAVHGEVNFVLMGVVFQLLSQVFEVTKILVQNMLMAKSGSKFDPLTTVLFMAPVCFVTMGFVSMYLHWNEMDVISAHASRIVPHLIFNCLLAFSLNVLVAAQIWLYNAVGFLLVGVVKDIMIVVVSAAIVGEVITVTQLIAFTITISGVMLYSIYRMYEPLFADDNILAGFTRVAEQVLGAPTKGKDLLANEEA